MLVVKPLMVVLSLTNHVATLSAMFALAVNLTLIAHLKEPTAMPMVLAKIAEDKETMEPDVLVDPLLMDLLELLSLTATVILSLVSALISVSKTLTVVMHANPTVKSNVVAVWNV